MKIAKNTILLLLIGYVTANALEPMETALEVSNKHLEARHVKSHDSTRLTDTPFGVSMYRRDLKTSKR